MLKASEGEGGGRKPSLGKKADSRGSYIAVKKKRGARRENIYCHSLWLVTERTRRKGIIGRKLDIFARGVYEQGERDTTREKGTPDNVPLSQEGGEKKGKKEILQ